MQDAGNIRDDRGLLAGFAGRVGRVRRDWCERYLVWKTALLAGVKLGQDQAQSRSGRKITCARGCAFCCTHYIVASLQECEGIVYWLTQHRDVSDAFIRRYGPWRAKLRRNEAVFQATNHALAGHMAKPGDFALRDAYFQQALTYRNLDAPCPFLAGGECSIYPVRPLTCAKYVVASPPAACMLGSTDMPAVLQGGRTPNDPPYFCELPGGAVAAPAALLVYEILVGGLGYLSKILGRPELAAAAPDDAGDPPQGPVGT